MGRNELIAGKICQNIGIKVIIDSQLIEQHMIHLTTKHTLKFK